MYYFSEPKSNDNDFKIKSSLKFQLIPYLPQPHCLVPSLPRVLGHPHEHWIQSPDQDYDPKLPLLEQTTHSLHWKWWWDPKNEVKEFRIISMLNNLSKINMHEQEVHKQHCSSEHRSKKKIAMIKVWSIVQWFWGKNCWCYSIFRVIHVWPLIW